MRKNTNIKKMKNKYVPKLSKKNRHIQRIKIEEQYAIKILKERHLEKLFKDTSLTYREILSAFVPNNKMRKLGLVMFSKKDRILKKHLMFDLYVNIERIIEEEINNTIGCYINDLVDIKDVPFGDKNIFYEFSDCKNE